MTDAAPTAFAPPDTRADPLDGVSRGEGSVWGRRAVWHEAGDPQGPTLLLIHGGGADEAMISWPLTLRAFPGRRVVAPDLPGYGRTRRFSGRYTIERLAEWTAAFCDEAGIAPGAVAGVSMGGATAIMLALQAPERVGALVPVAAFGLGGPSPLPRTLYLGSRLPMTLLMYGAVALADRAAMRAMRNVYHDAGAVSPEMVAAVRRAARVQLRTGSFMAFMRGETTWRGFRTDLSERLGEVRCPTLFVHGTGDDLVPARSSERAASIVPGARLALIEGTGHLPMRETPDAFHDVLGRFLADHG